MDAILGPRNFCNEIIRHYRKWATGRYIFQRNHDVILRPYPIDPPIPRVLVKPGPDAIPGANDG